jgi:hypothetical protein
METEAREMLRKIRFRNRMLGWMPWLERLSEWRQLLRAGKRWRTHGWFTPVPYFIRRAQLLEAARSLGADTAVETGTYRGDTTAFLASHLREVHTIEVMPALADLARERFRKTPAVTVWKGDSPEVLRELLPTLKGPVLFYLDGHDSGGITGKGFKACPVKEELEVIYGLCPGKFRVIIDDARLFGTDPQYPSIGEIEALMRSLRPGVRLRVEHDALILEEPP